MGSSKKGDMTISLPDTLCVREICVAHTVLLDALAEQDELILDVPEGAAIDLSFVQLVQSARLQAKASDKNIRLSKGADDGLRNVLERAGFLTNMRPEDAQFWLHEEFQP